MQSLSERVRSLGLLAPAETTAIDRRSSLAPVDLVAVADNPLRDFPTDKQQECFEKLVHRHDLDAAGLSMAGFASVDNPVVANFLHTSAISHLHRVTEHDHHWVGNRIDEHDSRMRLFEIGQSKLREAVRIIALESGLPQPVVNKVTITSSFSPGVLHSLTGNLD